MSEFESQLQERIERLQQKNALEQQKQQKLKEQQQEETAKAEKLAQQTGTTRSLVNDNQDIINRYASSSVESTCSNIQAATDSSLVGRQLNYASSAQSKELKRNQTHTENNYKIAAIGNEQQSQFFGSAQGSTDLIELLGMMMQAKADINKFRQLIEFSYLLMKSLVINGTVIQSKETNPYFEAAANYVKSLGAREKINKMGDKSEIMVEFSLPNQDNCVEGNATDTAVLVRQAISRAALAMLGQFINFFIDNEENIITLPIESTYDLLQRHLIRYTAIQAQETVPQWIKQQQQKLIESDKSLFEDNCEIKRLNVSFVGQQKLKEQRAKASAYALTFFRQQGDVSHSKEQIIQQTTEQLLKYRSERKQKFISPEAQETRKQTQKKAQEVTLSLILYAILGVLIAYYVSQNLW